MSHLQTLCCLMESPAGQMEVEGTKPQISFCRRGCGRAPRCQKEVDRMHEVLPIVLISNPAPSRTTDSVDIFCDTSKKYAV